MDHGYVKLWRKIINSRVFQSDALLKMFIWCIVKAAHKEIWVPISTGRGTTEVCLQPGQFIFGRKTASKELRASQGSTYKRLQKLKNLQILDIQSNTHFSIISIINWEAYQPNEKKGNSQGNNQVTSKEQPSNTNKNEKNEKNKNPEEILEQISVLKSEYPDQNLIDSVFKEIATTRKSGVVADSVLLAQLKRWKKHPVEQVEAGIKIYVNKKYAEEGKDENYLYGIIRKNNHCINEKETAAMAEQAEIERIFKNQKPWEEVLK